WGGRSAPASLASAARRHGTGGASTWARQLNPGSATSRPSARSKALTGRKRSSPACASSSHGCVGFRCCFWGGDPSSTATSAAREAFLGRPSYDLRLHRLDRIDTEVRVATYDKDTLETAVDLFHEVR